MLETDCLEQPIQHSDSLHNHGVFASHVELKRDECLRDGFRSHALWCSCMGINLVKYPVCQVWELADFIVIPDHYLIHMQQSAAHGKHYKSIYNVTGLMITLY